MTAAQAIAMAGVMMFSRSNTGWMGTFGRVCNQCMPLVDSVMIRSQADSSYRSDMWRSRKVIMYYEVTVDVFPYGFQV